ncbi:MAG TPA: porin [Polyangia bacterium]
MNQPTKSRLLRRLVSGSLSLSALLLSTVPVYAQDPAPAPTEAAPADPAAATVQDPAQAPAQVPAESAPAPAAEATPPSGDLADRIAKLEGQMEGLGEPFSAMQTDVAGLKKLKFSGYVQGRYEWHDDANYGLEGTRRRETNRFYVRRGRIKSTYAGDMTELVLQIDATGDGVALRDAEASFVLTNENPWLPSAEPWELKLTMGQFKVPFGFEVLQSSSERELPERTAMVRALVPGERDRGVRLQYSYGFFRFMGAVINGNFTNDADHGTFDQTSWKDIVGRVQGDFDFLVLGLSAHQGRFLRLTRQPSTAMPVAGYERYSRLRFGADTQIYADIPGLGGLTLRGELIWARDKQMDFGGVAAPASKCRDLSRLGWAGTLVQNLGDNFGFVVRIDQYDPTNSIDSSCTNTMTVASGEIDKVTNYGFGLLGYISGNLKATLAYEHFAEQDGAATLDNDAVTVQLQAKF